MKFFEEELLLNFFSIINVEDIVYVLLRNINNELPKKLSIKKDIDIIVKENNLDLFHKTLMNNDWNQIRHPYYRIPFLYGMTPFRFYNKEGLHIDVCCQLSCRSLNNGEWFPLDMKIQSGLWGRIISTPEAPWKYRLSYEDEVLHLMTRCIFDKKEFTEDYIKEIQYLYPKCEKKILFEKFSAVFFKFSYKLLELIKCKLFDKIIVSYLQFKDY
jgi:hypothetical protein